MLLVPGWVTMGLEAAIIFICLITNILIAIMVPFISPSIGSSERMRVLKEIWGRTPSGEIRCIIKIINKSERETIFVIETSLNLVRTSKILGSVLKSATYDSGICVDQCHK